MAHERIAVVIEDDQDIRELVCMILCQSGYDVHATEMGVSGVNLVRSHNPALVTIDVGLPDIDGFEVTERIRQFSDAHVIMLTARTDPQDLLTGREAGVDEYMGKPFRPRELRARADAVLARLRAAAMELSTVPPAES